MQINFRNAIVLSLLLAVVNAQQFPYQPADDNPKGVCTINGKVYYGIDCWCYTGGLGSTITTIAIVTLVIFFCISGCVWACIFQCYRSVAGTKDDGFESGMGSVRASMRKRAGLDTQI